MALNQEQITARLNKLGWKVTDDASYKRAVSDFQRGFNGPTSPLTVDGKAGPRTQAAVEWSQTRRLANKPTASLNFSFSEFACKCGGKRSGCARVRVHRELLIGLEAYRAQVGSVSIVSGYRCPGHNAAVGGASSSQHVYGAAADVEYKLKTSVVQRIRRFSGIGQKGGMVRHVDVRHVSGNNTTNGTPDRPTIWSYGA